MLLLLQVPVAVYAARVGAVVLGLAVVVAVFFAAEAQAQAQALALAPCSDAAAAEAQALALAQVPARTSAWPWVPASVRWPLPPPRVVELAVRIARAETAGRPTTATRAV